MTDKNNIGMSEALGLIAAYDKIQTVRKEEEQGIFASDLPWPYCYKDILPWRLFASAFTVGYVNYLLALTFGLGTTDVLNGFIPWWGVLIWMFIPGLGTARLAVVCIALWLFVGPVDPQVEIQAREHEAITQQMIRDANSNE